MKNQIIFLIIVVLSISIINIISVSGESSYIIKITETHKASFGILIYYNDANGQIKEYGKILEVGNQTYTISGELTSIEVLPMAQLSGADYATIKMEIIRNNQVLITKTTQNGNSITWDSVKEPLPATSVIEQIPAFPIESIFMGLIVVLVIYRTKKGSKNK